MYIIAFALMALMTTLIPPAPFDGVVAAHEGRLRPASVVQRLTEKEIGELQVIPGRQEGSWLTLEEVAAAENNPSSLRDPTFSAIKEAYAGGDLEELERALEQGNAERRAELPSPRQLRVEVLYEQLPLSELVTMLYLATLLLSLLSERGALLLGWFAWLSHAALLGLRIYLLGRPPVSNMFETELFVPFVAMGVALTCYHLYKRKLWITVGSGFSVALLFLATITQRASPTTLEVVQPVLNSQFWLMIHVLTVVSSYGSLCLAGIFGHVYLVGLLQDKELPYVQRAIFVTIVLGLLLLIAGTLLGGVWAAQSWGRFWDWDPKEAWAFITICCYLLLIHALRYQKIGGKGLAIGSIVGLWTVSFTWYGVNYILATGLHSYGFGAGHALYYLAGLGADLFFVLLCCYLLMKKKRLVC